MRESSTTVRLRTSLIMSVGIGCFGHRLRSFSIHPLPHRDTALYLEALASSAWTAFGIVSSEQPRTDTYIYDTRTRIRAHRGSILTPLSSYHAICGVLLAARCRKHIAFLLSLISCHTSPSETAISFSVANLMRAVYAQYLCLICWHKITTHFPDLLHK